MLLIGLIASVAIPFSLIFAGASTGFIAYADYSERSTKDLVPIIAATPNLTDVQRLRMSGFMSISPHRKFCYISS